MKYYIYKNKGTDEWNVFWGFIQIGICHSFTNAIRVMNMHNKNRGRQ